MPATSGSGSNWNRLLDLVDALRGPDGCPWDRAQTAQSLAGHLVEEAYEVMDSARRGAAAEIEEEIGDTAFLLALVRQEIGERGGATFEEILGRTNEKILRRHPHVFGGPRVADAKEASRRWEEVKREERDGTGGVPGSLPEPPPALPALLQAQRIQEKAAAVGFDWPDAAAILPKLDEELRELREALPAHGGSREARVREEVGDLLFAAVNLARALGLDAESTLREATRKFRRRFNRMAVRAAGRGLRLHELDLERLDALWTEVKREETPPDG
jgi:MazG family protein